MTGPDVLHLNIRSTADGDARIETVRESVENLLAALGAPIPLVVSRVCIECDLCDATGPDAESLAAALAAAAAYGWTHTTDGSDYCPLEG